MRAAPPPLALSAAPGQPSPRAVRLRVIPRLSGYHVMSERAAELLHGTLVALILRTLAGGKRHGYAIARAIEDATQGVVLVEDGSLYPALYRMERKGWIDAEWGISELGRKAKFYRLTPRGRRQLAAETQEWARFSAAISRVLRPA